MDRRRRASELLDNISGMFPLPSRRASRPRQAPRKSRKASRQRAFTAGFAVYCALLWALWETPAVYPLKIFVVLLHELSHAITVWVTGGSVERIALDPRQGGVTFARGGSGFLALSAGYLGSLLWGAGLVVVAHLKRVHAAWVNAGVGALVLELTVLYLRNPFAVVFGMLFGAALLATAWRIPELWNRRLVLVLGLTSCLYAVLDIKSYVLDRPGLPSDAAMLAELTGLPTLFWGVLWITLALAACDLLFRSAWRRA